MSCAQADPTPAAPAAGAARAPHTVPLLLGLTRFAHRLPAVVPVFVFLAVAWADFGAGLNIPALFWHEPFDTDGNGQWGYGLVNGLSVTLLFAYLWAVTFVLDATFNPDAVAGREGTWLTRCARRLYPTAPDAPAEAAQFRAYMAVTFLPCVVALALSTVLEINGKGPFVHFYTADKFADHQEPLVARRWPILAGVALGLLTVRALQWWGRRLARDTSWLVVIGRRVRRVFVTRSETQWVQGLIETVFAAQLLLFVGLALATLWSWYAPPVLAVCVLFGLIAGVCSWVWYQMRGWAIPAFVALGLLFGAANVPDHKVRFPHLDYERPVSLRDREHPKAKWESAEDWDRTARNVEARIARLAPAARDAARAEFAKLVPSGATYPALLKLYDTVTDLQIKDELAVLEAWVAGAAARPKQLPKLVIVTVTGGANRSALWTSTVLHRLHQNPDLPGFARHVRFVTGASGGMVGAAHYVGSLGEGGTLPTDYDPDDVAQHHIFPIASSLVLKEVPLFALPVRYDWDRGQALDRSLEGEGRHIDPAARERLARSFARPLVDLDAGERAGWRPSLVFSPMMIEDGRRLVISNRAVPYLTRSAGSSLGSGSPMRPANAKDAPPDAGKPHVPTGRDESDVYSYSGVEFFHLFPPDGPGANLRLSTAARMNATFPYVSPAVELPTVPARRVVDAGYYDNYGVGAAAAWVHYWRRWLRENVSGVLVIQVRDSASQYDRRHLALQSEPASDTGNGSGGARGSALAWLTGPLEAVDRARQATASYRNDEQLAALDEEFGRACGPGFFQTIVFERYSNVGMSWYLNSADKQQIRGSWDYPANQKALDELKKWWKAH